MKKIIIITALCCIAFFNAYSQCSTNVLFSFDPTCGGGNNGGISVTTTGALGTVSYTLNPGSVVNNTGSFVNLGPGTYTISSTDSMLCNSSVTVTLNNPVPVSFNSITHTYCNNYFSYYNTDIQATGGSGNYSLNIVPNVPTVGLQARLNANVTYTITVVDANGCTASSVYTHNPPTWTPLSVAYTSNNSACVLTNGNGSFCASASGGFPPYSYNLIGTTLTNVTGCFNNLNFGIHRVEVTDANGCVLFDSNGTSINNNNPSFFNAVTQPSHCNASDGSICVTNVQSGIAPLEYSINSGPYQTTNCFNNLASGTYTIAVKDANNCVGTSTVTLQGWSPSVYTTFSQPSCATSNGQICASISGGTAPFTYSLNSGPGQSANCFNSLAAGSYVISVSDANNCTGSTSRVLSNPGFLNWPSSTNQTCSNLGSIQITPSATANLPVTYTLMPGSITNTTGVFNGLTAGSYSIQATDASNCVNGKAAYVYFNSNYPGTLTASHNLGIITLTAPAGMTPPLQYRMNGGAWQSANTFPAKLCGGYHSAQVEDANGCQTSTSITVPAPTTLAGYSINANVTNPSCGLNDGQINIIVSPPNPSMTYCSTPNCSNTNSLFTNLGNGSRAYYVSDGVGCAKVSYSLNSMANCGTVHGKVYHDANSSCTQDAGEINLANQQIILAPGGGVTYTNASGNYLINNLPFGANSLFQNPDNYFAANSCGNYFPITFLPANTFYNRNFADTLFNVSQDAAPVIASTTNFTPGFNTMIRVIPSRGNQFVPFVGQVTFTLDNNLTFVNSSPSPVNVVGNTYTFNYSNSNPIDIYALTPVSTLLNTPIVNTAITSLTSSTDINPNNDTMVQSTIVLGAYDPNNKLVLPAGEGPNHNIAKEDSVLTYTINFQNVGNAPAHKVVLLDTLTDKLEIFKFKTIYSSHDYVLEIIDNSILKVTYDNIMLADSASNEPASHGQFVFQIHQKGNNNYGNVIKNKAAIYFDYNPPIITNEAFNTIYINKNVGISKEQLLGNFSLSPNPATEKINIAFDKNISTTASILDISGKVLKSYHINNSNQETIDISTIASGLYFIQIEKNGIREMKKFIKK